MECIICQEQIWPEEKFWAVKGEAVHHECCDLIEKAIKVKEIRFEGRLNSCPQDSVSQDF
jgi:hypothetical protein